MNEGVKADEAIAGISCEASQTLLSLLPVNYAEALPLEHWRAHGCR